ncbi:hypothetical protein [Pyrodictium abyssi]|uniref:Uncharacterized protein n=1 Tax=Pyrodictium abyssi TaxID=54256 RepID=A0ABM8ITK5_9CREN|nr:hypothetical protein PABY_04550 [Pyrodictium abyssi]
MTATPAIPRAAAILGLLAITALSTYLLSLHGHEAWHREAGYTTTTSCNIYTIPALVARTIYGSTIVLVGFNDTRLAEILSGAGFTVKTVPAPTPEIMSTYKDAAAILLKADSILANDTLARPVVELLKMAFESGKGVAFVRPKRSICLQDISHSSQNSPQRDSQAKAAKHTWRKALYYATARMA